MSELHRTFAQTTLSSLPPESPLSEEGSVDYNDDQGSSSSASSMSSTGTIKPTLTQKTKPSIPLPWSNFYAQELYLERQSTTASAKYHVYVTPPGSPKAPLFVLHHGAGSSAMSFALFALELRRLLPEAGVLAVEAREHGSVVWDAAGEVDSDLSIDVLAQDLFSMIDLAAEKMHWRELPRLILVGHSLGGAVVTHAAKLGKLGSKLIGYTVLDVVEGSAMDALKSMQAYLSARPNSFGSMEQAIEWHVRSRTLRNWESARASVPSMFVQTGSGRWVWRTDLSTTEAYWRNWFDGMSSKFLTAKGAKLLLLAGTDRLDKELMIGQMQGKFQLQVFPMAGHFIQEDMPEKTAEAVAEFWRRNDSSTLVLPPKVSELLAQGKKV